MKIGTTMWAVVSEDGTLMSLVGSVESATKLAAEHECGYCEMTYPGGPYRVARVRVVEVKEDGDE